MSGTGPGDPPSLPPPSPPVSEEALVARAEALAGRRLRDVARDLAVPVPASSRSAKGWAGQLVEAALGARAGSSPEPDFAHLGIELKTVPIDSRGRPRESTHVCAAPLVVEPGLRWRTSLVRRKLARVLWVPVLWERDDAPVGDRALCAPVLWSPSEREEADLRADWEELIELIALGRVDEISARHGACLQLRPKAASARATAWTTDPTGRRRPANPRGFYLRTAFTGAILAAHFGRWARAVPSDPRT